MESTTGAVIINVKNSWVLYDVANSAYILFVLSIIPIYFHQIAQEGGLSESEYLTFWSASVSIVTFAMLFFGPFCGTLSDRQGWRKPVLITLVVIGAVSCALLGFIEMWVLFLLVLCIGKIAFYASLVVYDGMLIDVAKDEEMDALSSKGYALGYIGSCIPFAVCLVFIALSDFTDMLPTIFTMQQAVVLSLILVGVWWVVMSLPLFKNYEQVHYRKVSMRNPRKSFLRFISTFKEIAKNKAMFFFMIAFFFYIDGVNTVMEMATAYGESLGIDSVGLLGGLLLTQIVAFPATIFMNKLAFRFGTHRIIVASILGYLAISMFAFFLESVEQFFILAFAVGLFQGTIQALSRSYFGRMVTKDDAGEYFGILDIFGKGSTIIGTALIALLTLFIDDQRVMVYVLIAVFLIGLFMFWLSIREKIYDNPATTTKE